MILSLFDDTVSIADFIQLQIIRYIYLEWQVIIDQKGSYCGLFKGNMASFSLRNLKIRKILYEYSV